MPEIITRLAEATGLLAYDLLRIMSSASVGYKSYPIAKRSGGYRIISQPAREVKAVQRAFVAVFLSRLPVHPSATAYRPGLSLMANAAPHAGRGPILKMDLTNSFPSIRAEDWIRYCRETKCIEDPAEVSLTAKLLFHRHQHGNILRLAIGAPSSPALSNVLMFRFDELVSKSVRESSGDNAVYTRYADDLTFSAPRTGHLNGIIRNVSMIVRGLRSPKLEDKSEEDDRGN